MIVSKNTWHYKLFLKWRNIKVDKWGHTLYRYGHGLTLCCYMKAVFIYACPRIIWNRKESKLIMLISLLSIIIWLELTSYFFLLFMIEITIGLLAIVGMLAIAAFILWVVEKIRDEETTQNIIIPYIKAKKQKICPYIDFTE